jgi:hypothetical protein
MQSRRNLEQRLHAGLKSAMKNQDSSTKLEQECNLVTQIYAQSAVTYLAVVVSGNSHLLPEVRSSVAKTLTALNARNFEVLSRNLLRIKLSPPKAPLQFRKQQPLLYNLLLPRHQIIHTPIRTHIPSIHKARLFRC